MEEHERLIARVRQKCFDDPGVEAALMYGSFTQGLADEWSDIEFWLFLDENAFATVDPSAWCADIATTLLVVRNEFDAHVAIFETLIRGEFHFASRSAIDSVAGWPTRGGSIEEMLVIDRTGHLRRALERLPATRTRSQSPEVIKQLCGRLFNWWLLGDSVRRRGELARAQAVLAEVNRHLLFMARALEDRPAQQTPSRLAENELSTEALSRYERTTSRVDAASLATAYHDSYEWARELWVDLATAYRFEIPAKLFDKIDARRDPDPTDPRH